MPEIDLPGHAYIPGQTPRHDEVAFERFHASVTPGMDTAALQRTLAWRAGLVFLDQGFFWEAHEVLEPVWMATSRNSAEHQMVQAVIQLANAALKHKMGRAGAARRLCDLARGHARAARSAGGAEVMGFAVDDLVDRVESLEREMARDMQ
ncbi:DUF309 domain-containing protein [Aestuariivita sp.]|uniref:DUF309 domain-containing protein n=1 Tax=Aestuariivita sp. TaxID=1872407 RepID=UPI002170FEFC|nr:DUF309 domain-containing protein [Aestuariivita sp.]MCE8005422.1 DUF309 domain-containing protein [Aestuariivita sp.]